MTITEFWDCCFEDTRIAIQAYQNRKNEGWEQTRLLVYTIYCTVTEENKRKEIYDLLPLPGDPTPEERQAEMKKNFEALQQLGKEMTKKFREEKQRIAISKK